MFTGGFDTLWTIYECPISCPFPYKEYHVLSFGGKGSLGFRIKVAWRCLKPIHLPFHTRWWWPFFLSNMKHHVVMMILSHWVGFAMVLSISTEPGSASNLSWPQDPSFPLQWPLSRSVPATLWAAISGGSNTSHEMRMDTFKATRNLDSSKISEHSIPQDSLEQFSVPTGQRKP